MSKLSVNLVAWNGGEYIPRLFDSLRKQTFTDWTLIVLDNNSGDNTVELIKKELSNFSVQYKIIENKVNFGFAGGHNQLFKEAESEYVLLLNQDVCLAPDCLEKAVKFLDANPETASVSPRLMKWNFEQDFTDQIDTLGLKIFRNRRVVDLGSGQNWSVLKNNFSSAALPVFGVSGALPIFRMSALKEVVFSDGGIFDSVYGSYKEDVDLAYRLAARGHRSYVLLDVAAWHDRSAFGPKQKDDISAAANKKTQSDLVKYYSYRNHLMTIYKNEYGQNLILDFPWILWYELKKFVYFLILDRRVLGGLKDIWKTRKDLAKKRKIIKNLRKLNWKEMRGRMAL